MNHSIVPVHLVVKSMRDNGYKNTAYAIAELIDNSLQHKSTEVELICLEEDQQIGGLRTVSRIKEIAVLDNGKGMDKDTLQKALQFGNGTNLDKEKQTGIGKFGMGLPSSSISQAVRVDVWSWQGDYKNALHTYIDVNEISEGQLSDVPDPTNERIPNKWLNIIEKFGKTGTLILWTNLDRCLWRTGRTIIDHSEFLVGRMYRKFIHSKQAIIKASVYKSNDLKKPVFTKEFLPNDPLYLMDNTSVREDLQKRGLADPMFVKWGGDDAYEKKYSIKFDGNIHEVSVRYSIATEATRKGRSAGNLPHGKHAGNNIGVSILRAGRELDLDTSWCNGHDPRERWWGVEVEFPPSLDEVFGVTNNKQYANNFRELGALNLTELLTERGQSISDFKDELLEENDLKALIIDLAKDIKNQLKLIRGNIEAQASRLEREPPDSTRHVENSEDAEKHATQVTNSRKEDGHIGQSDKDEAGKSSEEKLNDLLSELVGDNIAEAADYAKTILISDVKYQFIEANYESQAFFSVAPVGGKIIIKLNTTHPAYGQFVELLNDNIDPDLSKEVIQKRLIDAKNGMKLLLMAWARYEDEQPDGRLKNNVRDARTDWGKMATAFMTLED
ncbi:ATP-binding protein [bacterium]|nr:MAG: ATP-binding protein [bacterium]